MRRFALVSAMLYAGALVSTRAIAATPSPLPPKPVVNTGYATDLTTSTATFQGSISPLGTSVSYFFEYGPTQSYGVATPSTPLGAGSTVHVTTPVAGLLPDNAYHFRLVAVGPAGTTYGKDRAFVTQREPLTLTIAVTPNPVVYGDAITATGTVAGEGFAGHSVAMQEDPFPYLGVFRYVTPPDLTTAVGRYSFVVPGLTQSSQLRVGAAGTPAAFSPVVTELVEVRVGFHAQRTRRRGFARLYGGVAPSIAGAPVFFEWMKPRGGVVYVGHTTTKQQRNGAAAFSRVIRLRHPGHYRVYVSVPSGKQVSGYSRMITIR